MSKALPSWMYGNPEDMLDAKRLGAARRAARVPRPPKGMTEQEAAQVPTAWLAEIKQRRKGNM